MKLAIKYPFELWFQVLGTITILLITTGLVHAQSATSTALATGRVDENVIRLADDAFGASIGNEDVGIYNINDVRGFSPTRAGNARIEGLYYDQVWPLPQRLRKSTSIRIGISALGFPFPAPTGVVDYALRKPGFKAKRSFVASVDSNAATFAEFDAVFPLIDDKLSFSTALGLYSNESADGTDSFQHVEGLSLRWMPSENVEIQPFWARSDIYDDEIAPIYVPNGSFLPPKPKQRHYIGPQWVDYEGAATLYGAVSRFDFAGSWRLRAGLFRSAYDREIDHYAQLANLTPEGQGNYLVYADPPNKLESTSGEVRVTKLHAEGARLHQVHISLRARERRNQYGGSDLINLGLVGINQPFNAPNPIRDFSEQTHDEVSQQTIALAYEGHWKGVGQLNVGVQKTKYRKQIDQPQLESFITSDSPWLYNVAGAWTLSDQVSFYGGYTLGLEESGVAPQSAINRNEALPAIRTQQQDIGLRWAINPELKLIVGFFDVRKPYYSLDANSRFTQLGDIVNRGVEASVSGAITDRLNIVAGAMVSRPRVTGEGVRLRRLGELPVDMPSRRFDFNLDWRPFRIERVSVDLAISHTGKIIATRDNTVAIPPSTIVDVGARYSFKVNDNASSLRLSVSNLFDLIGFDVQGAGAYAITDGRRINLRYVIDF